VRDCLARGNGDRWIIDPILLDSAMQLAGVWARQYMDITVLPTGFKSLVRLRPITGKRLKGRINIPATSHTGDLHCDLLVSDVEGVPVFIVSGLSGVGSRSFNRFGSQPEKVKVLS